MSTIPQRSGFQCSLCQARFLTKVQLEAHLMSSGHRFLKKHDPQPSLIRSRGIPPSASFSKAPMRHAITAARRSPTVIPPTASGPTGRGLFQCSLDSCQVSFQTKAKLESHLTSSGHRFLKQDSPEPRAPAMVPRTSHRTTRQGQTTPVISGPDHLAALMGDLHLSQKMQQPLCLTKSHHSMSKGPKRTVITKKEQKITVQYVSGGPQEHAVKRRRPVFVSILIDTSGSMAGSKLTAVKEGLPAILSLLDQHDLVFMQTFDSTIERLTPRPLKPGKLDEKLITDMKAGGLTKLHDAVTGAMGSFKKESTRLPILVVLTDGDDTASSASASDAKEALLKPGLADFRAVLIGVGQAAEDALAGIDPQKDHTTLHSVEDSAKGIKKAFCWLKQRIQTMQMVQVVQVVQHVMLPASGGAHGFKAKKSLTRPDRPH